MIKKFIDKLLDTAVAVANGSRTRKPAHPFGKREEVPAAVHGINPQLLDRRAIDVVEALQDAGYEAYIVGGAVRDLLLGLRPKDFDVATNATPEQVKALFRRAFIIGKRFRIVHVVYGRGSEHEVIEVSTFRAHLDNSAAEQVSGNERTSKHALAGMKHAVDASGRVLRDNVWGPQDQDATRRDFTPMPKDLPRRAEIAELEVPASLVHRLTQTRFELAGAHEFLVGRPDPVTGTQPEINLGPLDAHRSLSRRHAKIVKDGAGWSVREEVGALNGTFHNGQRLKPGVAVPIAIGDNLRFGSVDLVAENTV